MLSVVRPRGVPLEGGATPTRGTRALDPSTPLFWSHSFEAMRWGLGVLMDTYSISAISPSTLGLVAGRRWTVVGRNQKRRGGGDAVDGPGEDRFATTTAWGRRNRLDLDS
ncbi:Os04g0479650 [Oryza sativa Japonica Group]|uniref:Os04g0479650 protein n=1 Tax=Oryza sativa subsp. japonica TaxID=39947 RepID=A0A0P0WBM9_ORYSJ|nr:Os04g0479650 [Oryza sativa Japonica Group]